MPNVYIEPHFRGVDQGDGGIRRVVEAQKQWLPSFGYQIVDRLEDADIVHTHAGHVPDVPVSVPWVTSCHGLYWQEHNWPKWAEKLNSEVIEAMRRADHVTAPSEWVAQALRRGMLLNPTVLYHGVDPEEWTGGQSQGYVLWNKTRVDPICDPAPLNDLARLAPDVRFVSTYGDNLPNIEVTGRLPYAEAREVIKAAGVYLATTRETFGIGTLEALATGVPVVGWDWGGQSEIIRHGETGWLAPVGDIGGLLKGIRWALQERDRLSTNAIADVRERWTWENAIATYARMYDDLLAKKKRQQESPRVSVVIPCYNLAQYLPDALRSLRAQTVQDWEAIVVDDASPDDTEEITKTFASTDGRIRYHRNPKNLYLAGALNAGAALARGRYLINLDADNMLMPQALELLAGALDADRSIAITYGGVQFVQEDGVTPDASVGAGGRSGWPQAFEFRKQVSGWNEIPSTAMLRRSVWERTGGWRRRWRTAEDADFWTRATSYGARPKRVTTAVTLKYRQRDDSMSRSFVKPDWPSWYPWSRSQAVIPFGAACEPPAKVGLSWPVSSAEPARVTVVIPVGPGHEHLLMDALDSVDAQTYRQWECVVINNTGRALPYVPSWARLLELPQGIGPAAARNAGLAATRASLVLFLDADDYLQPNALDVLVAVQAERKGVVYSSWYDDFGDGAPVKVYEPPEYDAHLLIKKGCIHAVTALYPRTAIEQAGGFDEKLSHWEDWDLQLALAKDGVCGTRVSAPLWTYRKAAGQRREANAAAFDVGKAAILNKWGRFWEGRDELMACRSCPGGGGGVGRSYSAPSASQQMQQQQSADGLVLLEFVGPSISNVTYRGKVTGAQYRFGNNDGNRRKYVHPADAEQLLAMKASFQRSDGIPASVAATSPATPQLQAPGAPTPMPVRVPAPSPAPIRTQPQQPQRAPVRTPAAASAVATPEPISQSEAVATVKRVADQLSYMDIRTAVPTMTRGQILQAIMKERASAQPREQVIGLLEAALPHASEGESKAAE